MVYWLAFTLLFSISVFSLPSLHMHGKLSFAAQDMNWMFGFSFGCGTMHPILTLCALERFFLELKTRTNQPTHSHTHTLYIHKCFDAAVKWRCLTRKSNACICANAEDIKGKSFVAPTVQFLCIEHSWHQIDFLHKY